VPIITHQRSFERYHPRPLIRPPFPQDWGSQPNPKLQSLLSEEGVKLYGLQIWQVHSQGPSAQKPITNLGENETWAYPGTAEIFLSIYPLLSQLERVTKLQTSNFVRTFSVSIGTKARGRTEGLSKFSGTHISGAPHGNFCGSSAFVVFVSR